MNRELGIGIFSALSIIGLFSAIYSTSNESKLSINESLHQIKNETLIPEEIKNEMFSRVKTFFGEEGLKKIETSHIIVVGLGGVGSHCAHMLVRSGVGKVRLVDFDQVTLSSLNRHAVATMEDVGISKAEAMKKRLLSIVPWAQIDAITEMFTMNQAEKLLSGSPDLVLDCIDDVNTKAELISFCIKNKIPILTSLGAGGKADPTRLRIAPLSDCINDPLAQKLKWKLKKHQIVAEDIMTVFSIEKPVCELLPLDEEQRNAPQDFGSVDYLRLRVIPVLGTSPSIFGQAMAAYVLSKLGGKTFEPEACERISKNLKHKIKQVFRNIELKRFKTDEAINLDDDDIEFVVQQVWKSRCPVSQKRFGGHVILVLTRWDPNLPPVPYNLVLLMQNEAEKLAEQGKESFPPEIVAKIESRLEWAKRVCDDSWSSDYTALAIANKSSSIEKSIVMNNSQRFPLGILVSSICTGLSLGILVQKYFIKH